MTQPSDLAPEDAALPSSGPTADDLRAVRDAQLTPRKILINLIGFAIGVTVLAFVVRKAVTEGDWERLRAADPWLVAGLIGATAISAVLNAMMFWATGRPLKHLRLRDMVCLNVVANMLNYAPIRLGALTRVLYHMRIDGLGLITIGAWFMLIAYLLMLSAASCMVATLLHPTVDGWWFVIALGLTGLGGVITRLAAGQPFVARFGRGVERILVDPVPLWGGLALRLADLAMFAARMAAALAILDIALPLSDAIILSLVALLSSLSPIGRVGVREGMVALVATRLGGAVGENVSWEQLALVESAGEAIFYVPLGIVGLLWLRRRWRKA
ncbi:MAG: lysylphosphatidylglycerol synthase domain-containing protein [Planctomycetota bacterium]